MESGVGAETAGRFSIHSDFTTIAVVNVNYHRL
jgi:hypothetical protein